MQVLQDDDALISGGQIRGRSPRDGAPLDPLPATAHDALPGLVARARAAQAIWSELTPHERARRLKKLRKLLLSRAADFAAVMEREQGKSIAESYTGEL